MPIILCRKSHFQAEFVAVSFLGWKAGEIWGTGEGVSTNHTCQHTASASALRTPRPCNSSQVSELWGLGTIGIVSPHFPKSISGSMPYPWPWSSLSIKHQKSIKMRGYAPFIVTLSSADRKHILHKLGRIFELFHPILQPWASSRCITRPKGQPSRQFSWVLSLHSVVFSLVMTLEP